MQENERYMESLEAKEQALNAEFEDFSNRVLSKEFVGGLLDAGKALLDFANNDVGAAVTRIAALSTSVVGIVGIAGTVIGKLSQLSTALSATGGATGFLGTLLAPKTLLIIGGVAAAIGGIAEVIRAVDEAAQPHYFDEFVTSMKESNEELEDVKIGYEDAKNKLDELNNTPYNGNIYELQAEKEQLEKQIEAYEKLLELKQQNAVEDARAALSSEQVVGVKAVADYSKDELGYNILETASGTIQISSAQIAALSKQYESLYDAQATIFEAFEQYFDETTKMDYYTAVATGDMELAYQTVEDAMLELGVSFRDVTANSLELAQVQGQSLSNFADMVSHSAEVSDSAKDKISDVVSATEDMYNVFKTLPQNELTQWQLDFIANWEILNGVLVGTGNAANDAKDGLGGLSEASAAAAQKATSVADGIIDEVTAVDTANQAFVDLVAQEIIFNNNNLDVSQKLTALAQLAQQAGYTTQAIASIQGGTAAQYVNEDQIKGYMRTHSVDRATAENALLAEVWKAGSAGQTVSKDVAAKATKTGGSAAKKSVDETADYAEKKAKQAAEKAAQEAEKAAKEATQKVKDQINETFDVLKETEEAYWDAKIDALETQNKLIDRQTRLEEKLKALQEAKQKKILLYKDGRFQYGEDIGAISKAQEDYNETWRDIYVEEQKEILNDLKDKALALIEEYRDKALENGQLTRDDISVLLSEYQELGNNTYQTVAYGMENITNLVASGMSALNGSVGNATSGVASSITGTMGSVGSAMKNMAGSMSTAAGLLNQQFGQGLSAIQSTLSNALGMSSGNYAGTIADFRREHWGETTGKFNKLSMLYGGDVAWWIGMMGKYLEDPEKNANLQIGTNADGSPMTLKQLYETDWAKQAFNMGSMGGIDDYIAREQAKYILNGGSKYDYDNLNKIAQDAYRELYFRNPSAIAPGAEWYSGPDAAFSAAKYGVDAALRYSGSDFNVWEGSLGKYYFGNRDVYGMYRKSQYDIYKQMASQGGTSTTARATAEWAQNKINEIDQQIYGETLNEIDRQLAENSRKWYEADEEEKKRLHLLNEELRKNRGEYEKKVGGNANGTLSWRGGLSVVGEKGPELRVLNRGDGIIPADVTANLWKMGANPTKYMNDVVKSTSNMFNISSLSLPNARDADSLVKGLKELAHQYVTKRS